MISRSPTLTCVCGGMLLAVASWLSDFLYVRETLLSVSPGATMCTCCCGADVVAGAPITGAAFGGTLVALRGGMTLPVVS